ncbi:MAG TPA: peroxidase family protein, partial [Marmoricola sp.]|nr:peroxidase family protein [Marmoricola sp.]
MNHWGKSFTTRSSRRRRGARAVATTAAVAVVASLFAPLAAGPADAAPVGQGFNLNRSDLRFILKQIKIAEAHTVSATAEDPCGTLLGTGPNQIPNGNQQGAELPWGLRTVDGTCNNLLPGQEKFGAADTVFPRQGPARFRDAETGDPDGPGPAPNGPTSYTQKRGTVIDSQPRTISNLIVDQTATNPAAVAASDGAEAGPSGTLPIPNVAPDVGLSAPFNSLFTLFGQFFDHGLDLTTKRGGTVFMPLKEDDPLFVEGSQTNFMVLTRAANQPGEDGIAGDLPGTPQDESADDVQDATNTTTAFVDQNQTYTSHPAHQVFLREFELNGAGDPVETGRLLGGEGGEGLAPWSAVKAQARDLLGIVLEDTDVLNVPLLAVDPYGNFIPGPNGFAQLVTATGLVEGTEAGRAIPANAVRTGHAFLDDIAHHAVPVGDIDPSDGPSQIVPLSPDSDSGTTDDNDRATYDDEMLGAHFTGGDGRANENIGLSTVHHIFHSEHNRLVSNIDELINTTETAANIADWHDSTGPAWEYGERLFQAARFVTEMQYQHLVFEEFARKVQPMVNLFGEGGTGYHTTIDPSIRAEFAHAVYRFGHSMLTETVARRNADNSNNDIGLIQAFLNPPSFFDGGTAGTLTPDQAAGSIVRGMTRQVGNEIDEFVTEALRNNLLGLPLDLATINMARARDTGVPTLNRARRAFYTETGNSALTPYESWADLNFSLKHTESLANFIAAYGTHPSIQAETTVAGRRTAAQALLDLASAADPVDPAAAEDAYNFLNSLGDWANDEDGVTTTGVDDIDLWVGGLAEKQMVFGGLLGPTFNYVFETQLEDLQDGDRFYYLSRTAGLNLLTQLEGNSFAELVQRNTDVEGLPADAFSRPDFTFDVSKLGTTGPILNDPNTEWNETTLLTRQPNGTIRFAGGEHVVWNGTANGDRVWSSEGDDTVRGNDADDWMQGGDGNDNLIGGLGDDTMQDLNGDDVLKGGDGDDAISSGQGFGGDLNQGGRGKDFIVGGNDITETFGGPGDDFVFAGDAEDTVFGDDGDDWIEAGKGPFNLLQGDNGAPFQDDPNEPGHDVLDGDGGEQDYDSEGGDDIMLAGPGIQRAEGMLGFDWVTHKNDPLAADSDMDFTGLLPPGVETNRDRFDLVEALSGWSKNDVLRGDDRVDTDLGVEHELNQAGIDRISGLAGLLPDGTTSFNAGNIIIGGAGNDLIEGRGGNDIIDGDAWLNTRLSVRNPANPASEIGS